MIKDIKILLFCFEHNCQQYLSVRQNGSFSSQGNIAISLEQKKKNQNKKKSPCNTLTSL